MRSPKSWNDVTLRQFIDLGSLDKSDYPNLMDYNIDLISILCDVDIEEIEALTFDDFRTLEKQLVWAKTPPKGSYNCNFEKITLGQFIDIEHYITDKENIPLIISILINESVDNVLEMNCGYIANVMPDYIKFREQIIKSYPNIFAPQFDEAEDVSEYDEEDLKDMEAEKQASKHSWEKFILSCCNNDFTKFDAVTDMQLILVFNLYSAR